MDIDDRAKKEIYEAGRKLSVEAKTLWERFVYHLSKSNWILYVAIAGILISGIWVKRNAVDPLWRSLRGSSISSSGMQRQDIVKAVFPELPPSREATLKIIVPPSPKDTVLWVGKDELWADIEVKAKVNRPLFNWNANFGIGALINPGEEGIRRVLEPAFFFSPVRVAERVDLDALASTGRVGGGISVIPLPKYLKNTNLGVAVTTPYREFSKVGVSIYAKISF